MNPTLDLALIYDLDRDELMQALEELGEPKYRGRQVWEGLYQNLWPSPIEFTNIPKRLRATLADQFRFQSLEPEVIIDSKDGMTRKVLFKLQDGLQIETVLMQYESRRTLCISSQAGCALGCTFCATGQMGLKRNLSSGEILEQVLYFARELHGRGEKLSNIVLMGMGEPFHNYDACMKAIDQLNDKNGMNIGARRFTISTVGLIPGIRRFAAENRQINLAISLHAADDELRSSMLPINNKYPIGELIKACREYVQQSGRRITFEWALIDGVNDSTDQAQLLAGLLRGMQCHVNLIPLNPTMGYKGRRASRDQVQAFKRTLELKGIPCTIRVRRGIEIAAGCGQLAIHSGAQ